jgi:hypothetical protein
MTRDQGIDRPRDWVSRILFSLSRRRFGKVLLPFRLHAASPSRLLGLALMLASQKGFRHLDPRLAMLAHVRVATLVGCEF